jgi:ADP-heptose:LPS heptosyltransferase
LFLKLTEMGATVLARAAFSRAEEMVGRENVYLLTLDENRAITELIGLIPDRNILTVRRDSAWAFVRDMLLRLWQIRRLGVDVSVDLEFFMRATAMLSWLSGARRRVGLHRFNWEAPYRGDLLTHRLLYNPHLHTAQLYDALVRAIEETPGPCPLGKFEVSQEAMRPPRFTPGLEEQERIHDKLQRIAGRTIDGPIVLFNPNCGDVLPVRKWPEEHYVALGRELLARHESATIFCIGLGLDADPVEKMCRAVNPDRMFSLAGKTDFRELLTLFTISDVLVSADSGPAHFASMADVEVVVLFGPETAALFGPLGDRVHVLSACFACSPCINPLNQRISPCTTNDCMRAIRPEAVLAAVERCLLARSGERVAPRASN